MMNKRSLLFAVVALFFVSFNLSQASSELSVLTQTEIKTDAEIFRIQSSPDSIGIREHFGDPTYFMKYLIKVPPVYV